jgi:hypothetical protein
LHISPGFFILCILYADLLLPQHIEPTPPPPCSPNPGVAAAVVMVAAWASVTPSPPAPTSNESLLSSLLGPQPGEEAFVRDFWQRKPAVIRRRNPGFFASVMTKEDLDGVLQYGVSVFNESSPGLELGTDWKVVKRTRTQDGEW